jgi:hypothetical protein
MAQGSTKPLKEMRPGIFPGREGKYVEHLGLTT